MAQNVLRFLHQKYNFDLSFFTELYRLKLKKLKQGETKFPIYSFMLSDGTLLLDKYSFEDKKCRFGGCKTKSLSGKLRYALEKELNYENVSDPGQNTECVCKFVQGTLVISDSLLDLRKFDKKELVSKQFDVDSINKNNGLFPSHIFKNPLDNNRKSFYKTNQFYIFCFVDLKNCSCYYYVANPVITTKNQFCYSYFGVIDNLSYTHDYNNFKLSDLNAILIHFNSHPLDDLFFVYSKQHSRVFNLEDLVFDREKSYINDQVTPLESVYFCSYSSFEEGKELPRFWRNFLVSYCKSNSLFSKDLNLILINCELFEDDKVVSQAAVYSVQTPRKEDFEELALLHGFKYFVIDKITMFEHHYSFLDEIDTHSLCKVVEELNLELITWRILPELKLKLITDLKVCVVGLGTLGCAIIRQLLSWGIEKFVLVDRGHVTNATRQSLYVNKDCYKNVRKVDAAEKMMVKIRPDVKATLINMEVPMPGHQYPESELLTMIVNTSSIVDSSDVMILATDSKESRWLPSLLAALRNFNNEQCPLVVSAGLGFDSCMVVRHSFKEFKGACYFCSDTEPLKDTITGRPFDETCTIVKPGITDICASMTVELVVSLTQHPKKFAAEHGDKTCIGNTPHSVRFSLSDYKCSQLFAEPSEFCICCSENILSNIKQDEDIVKLIWSIFVIVSFCKIIKPETTFLSIYRNFILLILTLLPFKDIKLFLSCAHSIARFRSPSFVINQLDHKFYHKNRILLNYSKMGNENKVVLDNLNSKVVKDPSLFKLESNPKFIKDRLDLFNVLYQKQQQKLNEHENKDITLTVETEEGDQVVNGKSYLTTPYDLLFAMDKNKAKKAVVANVLYEDRPQETFADVDEDNMEHSEWVLWDLKRPLEGSCRLKFFDFNSEQGQHVYWHSSAHILGSALETVFGGYLTIGPALSPGFYYDIYLGNNSLKPEDTKTLLEHVEKLTNSNSPFERLVCTKEEALELMKYNPFKVQLIKNKVPDGENTVCYRCGDFVDLCRGPHLRTTSLVRANSFDITKISSSYWLSNSLSDTLQRVYGISFPDKEQLKSYKHKIEEAKQRDHRVIGTNLNLFYFDTVHSPGSCFWLPNGAKIYNRLVQLLRDNYRLRGYQEVITPNIYSCDLWKQSGHYDNYKENMYLFNVEDAEWGMKPMNCPGHCLMFKHLFLSYKQLPLRLADFGVLHRNEITGSLSGLTRVRRFQQDDAHIFCTREQIMDEVLDLLKFIGKVYSLFDFRYEFKLSTKPAKALGDNDLWELAEKSLEEALNKSGNKWTLNPGDGAFYGPKIDIVLFDCLDREHQCGTIQLDFNLPIRFNLEYRDKSESSSENVRCGFNRPVIIHRAIFGSLERFVAIVLEQTKGKLPFWLSPNQVLIIPITDKQLDYAQMLSDKLNELGFNVDVDKSNNTINKKIKFGQQQRWNYMAIVGDREVETNTVSLRPRDTDKQDVMPVDDLVKLLQSQQLKYI